MLNYLALQFVTILDTEKIKREKKRLRHIGFTKNEADYFIQKKMCNFESFNIPPVAYQKVVGFHSISCIQKDKKHPLELVSFSASGNNEPQLCHLALRTFQINNDVKGTSYPIVIAGNGGYALSILLSKINAITLAGKQKNVTIIDKFLKQYKKDISDLLNPNDKWGKNYTNKFSKAIFEPGEFDSEGTLPISIAAERMSTQQNWEGIRTLGKAACEDIFFRSMSILSNQGISIPDCVFSSPSPIRPLYDETILVSEEIREHNTQEIDTPSTQSQRQTPPKTENEIEYDNRELTL